MSLFGGNGGFQGPGEDFGNDWSAFSTGRGRHMTGPDGARSNSQGIWDSTGTTDPRIQHISGPMGMSPRPQMRPDPAMASYEQGFPSGRGLGGGLLQALLGGGLGGRRDDRRDRRGGLGLMAILSMLGRG